MGNFIAKRMDALIEGLASIGYDAEIVSEPGRVTLTTIGNGISALETYDSIIELLDYEERRLGYMVGKWSFEDDGDQNQ